MGFEAMLAQGQVAEGLIARWLMFRGNVVVPAYQIEMKTGKGPQVFSWKDTLVAPDMLCFTHRGIRWIEAKHKSAFTWHYKTCQWMTGIDIRHYCDYLRVGIETRTPVWLLFYHRENRPSQRDLLNGSPPECPTGLFGQDIRILNGNEHHKSPPLNVLRDGNIGHGRSGMAYWTPDNLRLLATKQEVMDASAVIEGARKHARENNS